MMQCKKLHAAPNHALQTVIATSTSILPANPQSNIAAGRDQKKLSSTSKNGNNQHGYYCQFLFQAK